MLSSPGHPTTPLGSGTPRSTWLRDILPLSPARARPAATSLLAAACWVTSALDRTLLPPPPSFAATLPRAAASWAINARAAMLHQLAAAAEEGQQHAPSQLSCLPPLRAPTGRRASQVRNAPPRAARPRHLPAHPRTPRRLAGSRPTPRRPTRPSVPPRSKAVEPATGVTRAGTTPVTAAVASAHADGPEPRRLVARTTSRSTRCFSALPIPTTTGSFRRRSRLAALPCLSSRQPRHASALLRCWCAPGSTSPAEVTSSTTP